MSRNNNGGVIAIIITIIVTGGLIYLGVTNKGTSASSSSAASTDSMAGHHDGAAGPTSNLDALVGQPAPDFSLGLVDGNTFKLSEHRGKVVVIDFWATWCGPCKIEIPWFVEFQTKYGAQGLQVVGVSVDDTVDKLNPFIREFKMNYPVLQGLGHDDLTNAYGPMWGIPVTAVISRDGKICSKHTGLGSKDKFEDEIKGLL